MPHRIRELDKIAAELVNLAKRATDIGELQLANVIVEAVTLAHNDRVKIAQQLRDQGTQTSDSPL